MDNYTIYSIFFKNSRYIGKTVNLARRQKIHRSDCFKINNPNYNLKVFRGLRELGITKNEIICKPIITINNISEEQATKHERFWYDFFKADLNDQVPGRTREEWRQDNREEYDEYQKDYKEKNKESKLAYMKIYYQKNRESISKQKKAYRDKNRDEINRKKRESYRLNKQQ